MQFILDNLAATIIFTAVALAVALLQVDSTQTTVESTVSYMSKKQTLALGTILEQELKQIGEGTVLKIVSAQKNLDGQTTNFVFWRNNGVIDIKVEYRLVETDVIKLKGDDVQLYRMDRYENGVLVGGSAPTLRDFVIEPLDAFGNATTPGDAVLVRAGLRDTYPMGDLDNMHVGQTLWGMTLRPENL